MPVIPPEVYSRFEEEWAKEEKKLVKLGYPRPLIRKAKEYALGVLGGLPVKLYTEAPPEFKKKALEYAIDNVMRFTEQWVGGIYSVFAPIEKLREVLTIPS